MLVAEPAMITAERTLGKDLREMNFTLFLPFIVWRNEDEAVLVARFGP
jgi:hypothetical protein